MSLLVKICGITDESAAAAAETAGADAIGFVFSPSPRRLRPARARQIASGIGAGMLKVAVFARPEASEVETVLSEFQPDVVQADIESRGAVPASVDFLPVIHQGQGQQEIPEGWFLLDSAASGTGEVTDWDHAASLASVGYMILAGGLRPDNVGEAVATVKPRGVDVSSGVERKPGMKDPDLIRRFVDAARRAETMIEIP